ncbi:MAG: homoserine dehydrogenase [Clostridia bacterium]|nr:homoserine dehydrogenase [Clostridia bacterium]
MSVAILGFGVVGSGAYEILSACGYEVKKILDLRQFEELKEKLTASFDDILGDEEIKVVVEAMGGLEPAHTYVAAALKAKKNVVTSNKYLMCTYYDELVTLAKENGVTIRFGASVGGGIPWIYNLTRNSKTNEITKIKGIMNGTTNFILDEMGRKGKSFEEALKIAQDLGYAERDSSADIDGLDVARKTAISASIAFGGRIKEEDVAVFSLRHVRDTDIKYAKEKLGLALRYMGEAEKVGDSISVSVEPTLIGESELEAHVYENNNLISLYGKNCGRLSFYGQGAGKYPTGDTVALDVIDIIGGIKGLPTFTNVKTDNSVKKRRYFIRTSSDYADDAFSKEEKTGEDRYIITSEISEIKIHGIYKNLLADKDTFIARIEE